MRLRRGLFANSCLNANRCEGIMKRDRRHLHLEPLESRRLLAPVNVPVNGLRDGRQYDPTLVLTSDELLVYSTSNPANASPRLVVSTSENKGSSFLSSNNIANANEVRTASAYDAVGD